jgi:hypothetical protein
MAILYSNGCSYTANFNLSADQRYPKIIADRLGWECVQGAEPGSCNSRIIRTTIADCLKLKSQDQDIVSLIQLSHIHRIEYPTVGFPSVDPFLSIKVVDTAPAPPEARQYADFYWRLHADRHILINLLTSLIGLISFFNQENIKYQIFLGPREGDLFKVIADDLRLEFLKQDINVLDLEKFYMLGLTKTPKQHPNIEGMQKISDYFYDRIIQLCESA